MTLPQVISEVQDLGALDAATEQKLLADLHQTDPALWPLVVQQFRAALAYRRRIQQREMAVAGPSVVPAREPPGSPPLGDQAEIDFRRSAFAVASPPSRAPGTDTGGTHGFDRLPATRHAALSPSGPPQGDYPATGYRQPVMETVDRSSSGCPAAGLTPDDVMPASFNPQDPRPWQEHLAVAIKGLESVVNQSPQSAAEVDEHVRLRMLYLIAGQRDRALEPIPTITPSLQDFWSKELFGLSTWLDSEDARESTSRAAEAKRLLIDAATSLGESAGLEVRNLAFCSEVQSYGTIKEFQEYEFVPNQELLLYAEVDNFTSRQTSEGYHTALRSSYQIFDSRGQRVDDHEFTTTEETCCNRRRDFFIGHHLRLPKRIYAGKHTLQLTIEDLESRKIGQSAISFTIKDVDDR